MCVSLTPVLFHITTVIIEIYLQCFIESVSLRDIGKPTSPVEISSPNSLYLKAVEGAHNGSALTRTTSELTNSKRKKNSHKTTYSLLIKILDLVYPILCSFYNSENGEHNTNKNKILKIKTQILTK